MEAIRFIVAKASENLWVVWNSVLGDGYAYAAQVLPFSSDAAEVFNELRARRLRVGTMDLRIVSIAIANQMTLLTRNTVDFSQIPGLAIQDWLSISIGE